MPIEHSSAYALRSLRPGAEAPARRERPTVGAARPDRESAFDRALRAADEQLAAVEAAPPPAARAAWQLSVAAGRVASHPGVQAAARATAALSADALRVAAPLGVSLGRGAVSLAWQLVTKRKER